MKAQNREQEVKSLQSKTEQMQQQLDALKHENTSLKNR
jgi:hypothetical protein